MIYKTKKFTITTIYLLWNIVVNTFFILHSGKYAFCKFRTIYHTLFDNKNLSVISIISDGKIIHNIQYSDNWLQLLEKYLINVEYDFILYNHFSDINEPVQIIRYNKYSDLQDLSFTRTNYEFFTAIVIYNKEKFIIVLSDSDNNFYIVNNRILDKDFIKFYMNKYYNILLSTDDVYDIIILDNERHVHYLQKNNYIILKDNDYEILPEQDSNNSMEDNITDLMIEQLDSDSVEENTVEENPDLDCEHVSDIDCSNIANLYNQNTIDNTNNYILTRKIYKFFNWYEY